DIGGKGAGAGRNAKQCKPRRDGVVDARAGFENAAAEDGIGRSADHRIRHLLVVEDPSAATRAAHDIDAVPSAGLSVDIAERLHAAEAEARRLKAVQTYRA